MFQSPPLKRAFSPLFYKLKSNIPSYASCKVKINSKILLEKIPKKLIDTQKNGSRAKIYQKSHVAKHKKRRHVVYVSVKKLAKIVCYICDNTDTIRI